jgi:Ca2+-transporting ATPase
MSKQNAVIRKLTAVETLGCTQIICSDKTGTLTQNKMTVVESFSPDTDLLCRCMALCSDAELEGENIIGEPTECALVDFANKNNLPKNVLKEREKRIGEAPFDSVRKMMSTVHETENGIVQYTKGAPDEVLKKCTKILKNGRVCELNESDIDEIMSKNKEMADKALRVLSSAYKTYEEKPTDFSPESLENDLIFIGLVGMIDPVRPEVKDAMVKCRESGIRVVMITGDHKDTAVAIAKELGILENPSQAITGAELNNISDDELSRTIQNYSVYARVQPEHKVRIVKAWKSLEKIVAMTGDGVNDAPSIKSADIGIGMGITGTDVTKNVADMILADDNFATIVDAAKEGRRIYDNIRKAIQFLLASNLSEVISIFFAMIAGFTILKPAHILWINLITDSLPALALGVESEEENIMKKPPRSSKEGIFHGGVGYDVLYQGFIVSALTITAYLIGHVIEGGAFRFETSSDGMTMAFLTMSMAEIFHSFNMRSLKGSIFKLKKQNVLLWASSVLALALTTAVIYIPFLRRAFEFEFIDLKEYLIALGLALSIIPIVEIVKLVQRKIAKKKNKL